MSARPRRARAGRRRRAARAGLVPILAFALAGALASIAQPAAAAERVGPKRPPLAVACSGWVFPSRPLAVTLEQTGVLAGRALAVDLFVDDNQWQRVTTQGGRTETRLELPPLAPGRHALVARTARESARTEFRVVPWWWLGGALAAVLGVAGLLLGLLRRRRPRAA